MTNRKEKNSEGASAPKEAKMRDEKKESGISTNEADYFDWHREIATEMEANTTYDVLSQKSSTTT